MTKKKWSAVCGLILGMSITGGGKTAFASALDIGTRGGANAYVCNYGKINQTAELYDFWEAKTLKGIEIVDDKSKSLETQLAILIERISAGRGPQFGEELKQKANRVLNNIKRLPKGVELTPFNDSFSSIRPDDHCEMKQLALFMADRSVEIKWDIWSTLSPLNRAALILHEALYEEFRQMGATNSIRVRNAIAMAASGVVAQDVRAGLPPEHLRCASYFATPGGNNFFPRTQFYLSKSEDGLIQLHFDLYFGEPILTTSIARIGYKGHLAEFLLKGSFEFTGLLSEQAIQSNHEALPVSLFFEPNTIGGPGYVGREQKPNFPSEPFICTDSTTNEISQKGELK